MSDTENRRVARFDGRTGALLGSITEKISSPQGLTVDGAGDLWVVQNGRLANGDLAVLGYSPDGKVISSLGHGQSSASGGLSNPAGVAIDTDGNAFVTVPDYGWVCQFRTAGSFRAEFGLDGRGALRFPLGIAVDAQGRIFVADSGNSRIVHFGVAL